jgi:hypothetical protein
VLLVYIVKLNVAIRDLRCVLFVYIIKLKVAFGETCVGCCLYTS